MLGQSAPQLFQKVAAPVPLWRHGGVRVGEPEEHRGAVVETPLFTMRQKEEKPCLPLQRGLGGFIL